jgi:hypothetical protein
VTALAKVVSAWLSILTTATLWHIHPIVAERDSQACNEDPCDKTMP